VRGSGRFVVDVDPDLLEAAAFSWGQVSHELGSQASVLAGLKGSVSEQDWSGQARQAVFTEAAGLSRELSRFAPLIERAAQEMRSLAQDVRDVVEQQVPALNRAWDEEAQAREARLRAADRAAADTAAAGRQASGASPETTAQAARQRAFQDCQAAQRAVEVRFENLLEDLRERFTRAGQVIEEAGVVQVPASTIIQFRDLGLSGAMPGFCSLDGGVFPPKIGAAGALASSLPMLWAHHALGEATTLAASLANGTAQAGDVARLRSLLGDIQEIPGCPAEFLQTLSANRLVDLTAALSLTDPQDRADAAASQATLGELLAAATQKPDQIGQLDTTWVKALQHTGRERHTLTHTTPATDLTAEFYGYSAIGVLLGHGTPSTTLLNAIGGDLLNFERTAGGPTAGSADFWRPTMARPFSSLDVPVPGWDMDLTGTPGTALASWDPVTGLMTALGRDPHLAQDFFLAQTSQYTDAQLNKFASKDGLPDNRLDRIDYLLTDRGWGDRDDTAINAFGHALVQAGAVNPDDQKSVAIMAGIVHEISLPEDRREQTFATTDLVDPRLRTELATIVGSHMASIHKAYHGSKGQNSGLVIADRNVYLPGRQNARLASLGATETARILAELSKDPEARSTLTLAASAYATSAYQYELLVHQKTGDDKSVGVVALASGHVLGAIAYGKDVTTIPDPQTQKERHENSLQFATSLIDIATAGATGGAGALTGPAGAVATGTLGETSKMVLKNVLGDLHGDVPGYEAIARYDTSISLATGERHVREIFRAVAIATGPEKLELKRSFIKKNIPTPISLWEDPQKDIWEAYAINNDNGFINGVEQDVLTQYNSGYNEAKSKL
jgi:uncharacterized protein YukE